MANSDKNIIITPSIGSTTADPTISFTGAGNSTITLRVLDTAQGGLSFEGYEGQLIVISNGLTTAPIFAINDKTGIPMMQAWGETGRLYLAQYPGYYVGIGTTVSTQTTYDLEVFGGAKLDDVSTGSGKFNTNLTGSASSTLTGVLNPILSFSSTSGKRYIIHSITAANIARVQPQGAGATVGISTTTGAVTSVNLTPTGAGYTSGDVFVSMATTDYLNRIQGLVGFGTTSFVGIGSTGDPALVGVTSAIGIVTSVSGGKITGIALTYNGFGYTTPPVVSFNSPVGLATTTVGMTTAVGTAVTAVLTYGEVVAAYLNVPGTGYKSPPTVSIASTTGIRAQITADVDSDGRVIRLNLINRGYGYSRNNALGNNEENEVYITLPPLAKTEVAIDGRYDMVPVGNAGIGTVETFFAFGVPIPVGGVLELLKQPMVLNPYDKIELRGIDANGSGLSNAVDVHISYEEQNNSQYVGVGTVLGSTIGLGTNISRRLLNAASNPIMLQSLRMTNTEFEGDYDVNVKIVSDVTNTSLGSSASIGVTTFFASSLTNVSARSVVSIGTFINKAPVVGTTTTSFTIGVGKTTNFSIPVGTAVSFYVLGYDQYYLARNLMIPAYASIELFEQPKRLERYSSIDVECDVVGIDTNIASTIDIQLSGKNIV